MHRIIIRIQQVVICQAAAERPPPLRRGSLPFGLLRGRGFCRKADE